MVGSESCNDLSFSQSSSIFQKTGTGKKSALEASVSAIFPVDIYIFPTMKYFQDPKGLVLET